MITQHNVINEPVSEYSQLTITLDDVNNVTWCAFKNRQQACFTQALLDELSISQDNFTNNHNHNFFVISSENQSVFSLGGDLVLFKNLILQQNRKSLYQYMKQCIDAIYGLSIMPACEGIALVQGTAFGGGFETALACDTIIAEECATFGFPDRLFNSFPGMGAYSYLSRKINPSMAQKIIRSARTYTAKELYDMGIVDKLVPAGEGVKAVNDHIANYNRYSNSYDALKQIFQAANPVDYNELLRIGELWVNTVLRLSEKDLALMERLAASQNSLLNH
ncbi:MAG: crotonase/enoyl-CoA hydratase family protein [Gammaproteobacteria bacterium]|nr:crotonase/enoyl-CoA hydratase family protein [Gammaproteobacteria bacterium]